MYNIEDESWLHVSHSCLHTSTLMLDLIDFFSDAIEDC